MTTKTIRVAVLAGGLGFAAALWAAGSNAALPPQYDRWLEFAALVADGDIPAKLGVNSPADRIERIGEGAYRVYGGMCYVTVTLARRMPSGPNGEPIAGAPRISVAELGERRCE